MGVYAVKTTHQGFSISFVCGAPGSGKSFCLTRDVIERLSSGFAGKIITNLPLEVDKIADYVAAKRGGEAFEVAAQLVLLDRDTLRAWQDGHGGPWDFAAQGLADGNDFILDECHLFCRKSGQNVRVRNERWERWLGEVRHEGWRRCVFVTQDETKVGLPITQHAELRYELTNGERRRDPILRIPLHYWYELIASVTREYRPSIAAVEYRRVKGKLREQHVDRYPLDPYWFQFYRSYEAAGGGTGKGAGGSAVVREFKRRPVLAPRRVDGQLIAPTWLWFLGVHWWRFFLAGALLSVVVWLTALGGMTSLLQAWMSRMGSIAAANGGGVEATRDGAPTQVLPAASQPAYGGKAEPSPPAARPTAEQLAALLHGLPEGDRNLLVAELRWMADGYRLQKARADRLVANRARERKLVRVVAITEDKAWFSDPPCSCKLGEVIDEGPYKGRRMERLDVDGGWVELTGGVRLWVGRGIVERLPDADAPGGDAGREAGPGASRAVPEPVRALGAGEQAASGDGRGAANHDHGAGDGLRSILSGGSPSSGPVDRGR